MTLLGVFARGPGMRAGALLGLIGGPGGEIMTLLRFLFGRPGMRAGALLREGLRNRS